MGTAKQLSGSPSNYRGVYAQHVPLYSKIKIATSEAIMWDRLHRKMWPTATLMQRDKLKQRMLQSLQDDADPEGPPMSAQERYRRVEQMQEVLRRLPPDANNKLMGGTQ